MHATAAARPGDTLDKIRAEIDRLDHTLLTLIAHRCALAARACAAKGHRDLFRPAREHEVLARVAAGPAPPALAHAVWVQLIAGALATEGIARIVIDDEALRVATLHRFGTVIPIVVDAAPRPAEDAIVIVTAGRAPPGAVLDTLTHQGRAVAHVVGPAGDRA